MPQRGRPIIRIDKETGEELGQHESISNAVLWLTENG